MNRLLFFIAIEKGYIRWAHMLMKYSLHDNLLAHSHRTYQGYTPLTYAVVNNRRAIVQYLLLCHASCIKDCYGYTPLEWAELKKFHDIANVIREHEKKKKKIWSLL